MFQVIWKETGWGTIIYLAALLSIDVDAVRGGGGRRRRTAGGGCGTSRCRASSAVTILLLILRLGSILSVGFEQILLQRDAVGPDAGEVLDTYVYFQRHRRRAVGHDGRRRAGQGHRRDWCWCSRANKIAHRLGQDGCVPMMRAPSGPSRAPARRGWSSRAVLERSSSSSCWRDLGAGDVPVHQRASRPAWPASRRSPNGGLILLWPQHPTLEAYRTIFQGGIVTRAIDGQHRRSRSSARC